MKLEDRKKSMIKHRTPQLWFQYMEMVDILCKFIKAERTGNWKLHLQAVYDMLPYLAASGHNLYAKSIHIYLQQMSKLHEEHPKVYQHFENGLHVVRRSDRFWAGLSSDLVIEQVLMRSMKTTGGLTRGRGLSETQRLIWLLSMPACAQLNNAMQDLTGITYETSEQHKDLSQARQVRDCDDTHKLVNFFQLRNPFSNIVTLRSITSGVNADGSVNVDNAHQVGAKIVKSLTGKNVIEHSFKKKDQAVTLASRSSIKINDETIQVDTQLLFQRLITAGMQTDELPDLFTHEMCSYPPALFEGRDMPRPANKSALADAIWALVPASNCEIPGNVQYVLDGGYLLHRLPWPRAATYQQICDSYVRYVKQKYGQAIIVFDGYNSGPSTKDCAHHRRLKGHIGAQVNFVGDMVVHSKKEDFLSNYTNKQQFINMLSNMLQNEGCQVHNARGDADLLIVTTALEAAIKTCTVVVGDDTDLLILLLYHMTAESCNIYLRPEPKQSMKKQLKVWNIRLVKGVLGNNICTNILFIHAVLGCDTTSRLFGIGKRVALKKALDSPYFCLQASVFSDEFAERTAIVSAGENSLVCLYGGKPEENLDILRYMRYCDKTMSTTSSVSISSLPPTSAAAKYHSLRVYYQVQEWQGKAEKLSPLDWGWREDSGKLLPISTDKEPAPKLLLEIIRCNCKTGCTSSLCSCRKHGLVCSVSCGECRGVCSNSCQDLSNDGSDENLDNP